MNFRQLFENKTPITDYDTWRDQIDAQGGEIHPQRDRVRMVAQSWSGETMGEFNLRTGQGWITPSQSINEFDAGEGGFGPFKLYAGDAHKYHHVDTFNSLDAAIEEVEFLIDSRPELVTTYWKIVDGTGEQVWDQDPDTMYDKMRSAGKMQFKKPGNKGVAEGAEEKELYGLHIGDTVKAEINGKRVQGDVIDIFPDTMEVELLLRGANAGKTVTVDVRDTEYLDEQGVAENTTPDDEKVIELFAQIVADDTGYSVKKVNYEIYDEGLRTPSGIPVYFYSFDGDVRYIGALPGGKPTAIVNQDGEVGSRGSHLELSIGGQVEYVIKGKTLFSAADQQQIAKAKPGGDEYSLVMIALDLMWGRMQHKFMEQGMSEGDNNIEVRLDGEVIPGPYHDIDHARNKASKLVSYQKGKVGEVYVDGKLKMRMQLNKNREYFDEQDVDEGLKGKIAGAALAAANLLGSPAQAAEEPVKPITIAYVQIDGEVRKYNLGDKFSNAKEAEQFISNVLDKQGISGYTLDIKHGYPKQKTDEDGQGVAEGEQRMSRAAKGNEKYGKDGMKALARAGREGASEKTLDAIRDKHDRYDDKVDEAAKHGLYYNVNRRKKAGISRPASSPKAPTAQAWKDAAKTAKTEDVAEDWQKANKQDKTDGMSSKAVKAYRRENPGSKLKTAVTTKPSKLKKGSKAAKRRKSFCARMSGNKGPMKKPNGKPTPKALALRRWNCESIEEMQNLAVIAEQKIALLKQQMLEGEYKDTVNKSKIPAVQRKAQGGDWKVSTKDLEHERSKSPTGAEGLAKAKQRLDMNENLHQLPPEVVDLIKKIAQSNAAPEHKAAIIKSIMAKYQPVKDIAEAPKQTAREKFNKGLKRAGFDPDAAAKRLTDLIARQKAERERFEKENPAVYGDDNAVKEEKVRLDPKCWTGKKIGNPKTKIKGGVRVNNCVPK